jgi:hypothetical protein
MRAAAWLLILLVGGAASLALPGATILFLLAPALAIVGIAIDGRSPMLATILLLAAAILQFLMFAELLALIEMLLIDGPLWAVAPLAALAALPVLVELEPARLRPALALAAVATLGFTGAALAMPRSSAERPLGFSIDYFRDTTNGSASWGIATKQAPLPDHSPAIGTRGSCPTTADPLDFIRAAHRHAGRDGAAGGERSCGWRTTHPIALSPGGGDSVMIRFPEDAKLLALGLPGETVMVPATGEPKKATLRAPAAPATGW